MILKALIETEQDEPEFGLNPDMQFEFMGFMLVQEEERDNDNIKIYHIVTLPNGKSGVLDHTPYEYIDEVVFRQYVWFFKQYGRFPIRDDAGLIGPLKNATIHKLMR